MRRKAILQLEVHRVCGGGGVFRKRRPRRAVARTRRRRAGPFRQARSDLVHARDVRKRIPAQLRRSQQIAARAVRLGRVGAEVLHWTFPDRLHPPELAVLTDAAAHRRPRPFDAGEVRRLVKYAVVHAPGERVTEERGRAHLRRVGLLPVEETGGPRPVRALDRPHLRAHLLEQRREPPPFRAVRGKLADDQRQAGENPSVPASPEELLAIGSRPPHIPRVAPEEMILAVVEVVVGGAVLAHHEIEVFLLARDRRELRPHGRGHEKRVAPVPAPPVQDEALAFAAGKRRIDVRRHERVKFRAHGRHDRIIALRARDVKPGLSDAVRVAHVGVALLELPAVRAPLVADGVDVPALTRHTRELRQPGIERAVAPVAVVGALRMRQHPVRHLHAVGHNRLGVGRGASPFLREHPTRRTKRRDDKNRSLHCSFYPLRYRSRLLKSFQSATSSSTSFSQVQPGAGGAIGSRFSTHLFCQAWISLALPARAKRRRGR